MKKEMIILLVPKDAWETLAETIEMDCQSSVFDPKLRKDIQNAYAQVKVFHPDQSE